ncbi:hypothetical protein FACS189421_09070 [Bacteroidia bacterium]|nr:hypothetical protein FACS189421_09070 [Bacteroidia bacterium]GHT03110.1 hypothetical protein FACS189423_03250 [Bacteroidia bacterium]
MAKPILATPTLKGKDARRFLDYIESNKNKQVDKSVLSDIAETAAYFKSMLKK